MYKYYNELINILFYLNGNTIQTWKRCIHKVQAGTKTYLTLTVLVGQESECLEVIKTLLLWHVRDWLICPMCHTFPSTFFYSPPFIPFSMLASGFHYHPHFLHFCVSTFPLPHFSPAPIYSQIGTPRRVYFSRTFLSAWLQFYPLPLQASLLPPELQMTTHFPWKHLSSFSPPLKPFPDSSTKKAPAAQISSSAYHQRIKQSQHNPLRTCP